MICLGYSLQIKLKITIIIMVEVFLKGYCPSSRYFSRWGNVRGYVTVFIQPERRFFATEGILNKKKNYVSQPRFSCTHKLYNTRF